MESIPYLMSTILDTLLLETMQTKRDNSEEVVAADQVVVANHQDQALRIETKVTVAARHTERLLELLTIELGILQQEELTPLS